MALLMPVLICDGVSFLVWSSDGSITCSTRSSLYGGSNEAATSTGGCYGRDTLKTVLCYSTNILVETKSSVQVKVC